jgi:hypothetical protein
MAARNISGAVNTVDILSDTQAVLHIEDSGDLEVIAPDTEMLHAAVTALVNGLGMR